MEDETKCKRRLISWLRGIIYKVFLYSTEFSTGGFAVPTIEVDLCLKCLIESKQQADDAVSNSQHDVSTTILANLTNSGIELQRCNAHKHT